VLVTTHSPFIISNKPDARVFQIEKRVDGCTTIAGVTAGDQPRTDTLAALFTSRALAETLEAAYRVPATAKAVVVVEGTTDRSYLLTAARVARRPDLVADLHIVAAGGAEAAAIQAVFVRMTQSLPVVAMFDSDEMGLVGAKLLRKLAKKLPEPPLSLYVSATIGRDHQPPIEAEDLIPTGAMKRFIQDVGPHVVHTERVIKGFANHHYDLGKLGKEALPGWLDSNLRRTEAAMLIQCLEGIRRVLGLLE
jgi:putative ATP-dependent endonuclease of OLD family